MPPCMPACLPLRLPPPPPPHPPPLPPALCSPLSPCGFTSRFGGARRYVLRLPRPAAMRLASRTDNQAAHPQTAARHVPAFRNSRWKGLVFAVRSMHHTPADATGRLCEALGPAAAGAADVARLDRSAIIIVKYVPSSRLVIFSKPSGEFSRTRRAHVYFYSPAPFCNDAPCYAPPPRCRCRLGC
jgi:hypothetical protein